MRKNLLISMLQCRVKMNTPPAHKHNADIPGLFDGGENAVRVLKYSIEQHPTPDSTERDYDKE